MSDTLQEEINPEFLHALDAEERQRAQNKFSRLFPEIGPYRRELYPKQMEFFRVGAKYRERMFRAGNQVGKSLCGCYEDSAHLTGRYPEWWEGRRFSSPTKGWVCAETAKKVREVLQEKLFGAEEIRKGYSIGLIPGDCVGQPKRKSGTPDAIDFIPIRHISGGWSRLVFKSYEEGWEAFESDVVDFVHFDEEPDPKIYAGGLMRTITRNGVVYITVTPLQGLTELQQGFMVA
jgi:phage terminase large subunit-like protein